MLKFQRNYKIVFEIGIRKNLREYIPQEEVTVSYPITLRLDLTHSINLSNISRGNFQLLNLAPETRAKLWKDLYNHTKYITMYVYAGYQDIMPLIFKGDINQCYSYRESGGVDWITDIKSDDGTYLFQYGISNYTFNKGTQFENLLQTLLADMPEYKIGYVTPKIQPLARNQTFIGQTLDLLGREYGNYQVFIDKGELNIIDENDVLPGNISVLTSESGILGSPKRSEQYLNVSMIFEPQLRMAQAIELLSETLPFVNNIYKVVGISHRGVISPRESGSLVTQVQLFMGNTFFNELKKSINNEFNGTTTNGLWQKPVQGIVSSPFGLRNTNVKGASKDHHGIDIAAPIDTPVIAPANGKITFAGIADGYGKCIYMDNGTINGKKVISRYGHLNNFNVHDGQSVFAGEVIGYVGSTGISSGPHLHFETREIEGNKSIAVNPIKYIGTY